MTDASLVRALKLHEHGSAELLWNRYGRYVERLIVRTIGMDPEVPDLINEAFARALEGIKSLRETQALKGWIAVAASPEVNHMLACTYAILDALPPDERISFALRVIDGMELTEIAQVTGVSLATVKRRIACAKRRFWDRARLHPMLRDHAPDGDDTAGEEP
jgi:RNA polymerase sigma-70 factor (ECF subfamily)